MSEVCKTVATNQAFFSFYTKKVLTYLTADRQYSILTISNTKEVHMLVSKTKSGDVQVRVKKGGKWYVATGKTVLQALKKLNIPIYL
jgi:hypothetical protein